MGYLLLTGATGFLGSYLLRDALLQGEEVAVLVRGSGSRSPEARVRQLLRRFEGELGRSFEMPRVLAGNLTLPYLGLGDQEREWVRRHCDRLVHCAASLEFVARDGEPYRSNVDGTRFALQLAEATGIAEFHHVSTAYVCGTHPGPILEADVDVGRELNNDYERSKLMAEGLVRSSRFLNRWSILRPSIIVGDSRTGFGEGTSGLSPFLKLLKLRPLSLEVALEFLGMEAEAGLNLVPVDWVSKVITRIVSLPDRSGGEVFHLTNPRPVTVRALWDAALPFSRAPGRSIPLDRFQPDLSAFDSYLKDHPHFDSEATERAVPDLPCPILDPETLDRLSAFLMADEGGSLPKLALTVIGSRATVLDLTHPLSPLPLDEAGVEEARVRAFCSSDTFDRLLSGSWSIEEALHTGAIGLEGEPDRLERALLDLGLFVSQSRTLEGSFR